jgi:hypothetical protein
MVDGLPQLAQERRDHAIRRTDADLRVDIDANVYEEDEGSNGGSRLRQSRASRELGRRCTSQRLAERVRVASSH